MAVQSTEDMEESRYTALRQLMVDSQIISRGIHDPLVLDAMQNVPRHRFVLPEHRAYAYSDGPLPIGYGQTISQPYIVALMTELIGLQGNEKVLEIGCGSGYQAAILSCLAREIHSIERIPELANSASKTLAELGMDNVHVHIGDGSLGLMEHAPYDAILVTAAAPRVPQALLDQMAAGGRLVIPVGSRGGQVLEVWKRRGDEFACEENIPVAFVPLVGQYGWRDG